MKKKETKVVEEVTSPVTSTADVGRCVKPKILPITQEFGNGEINILRDKINEIIKANE